MIDTLVGYEIYHDRTDSVVLQEVDSLWVRSYQWVRDPFGWE